MRKPGLKGFKWLLPGNTASKEEQRWELDPGQYNFNANVLFTPPPFPAAPTVIYHMYIFAF